MEGNAIHERALSINVDGRDSRKLVAKVFSEFVDIIILVSGAIVDWTTGLRLDDMCVPRLLLFLFLFLLWFMLLFLNFFFFCSRLMRLRTF